MQTPTQPAHAGYPEQGTQPANTPFKFKLTQQLQVSVSGEQGECIARSEHAAAEPQYLLRYRAADGRAVEAWWTECALSAVAEVSTADVSGKTFVFMSGHVQPFQPELGDRRFWAVHASRSAPRCSGCTHVVKCIYEYCNHPSMPVEPDSGVIAMTCASARKTKGRCGPEGRLFTLASAI